MPKDTMRLTVDPHSSSCSPRIPQPHSHLRSTPAAVSLTSLTPSLKITKSIKFSSHNLFYYSSLQQQQAFLRNTTRQMKRPGNRSTENTLSGNTKPLLSPQIQRGNRNPGIKPSPNKNKTRYQHLDISSPQSQMSRFQCKSTVNNIQDSMSSLEPSIPTTEGPEYSTISEAQERDLKTVL